MPTYLSYLMHIPLLLCTKILYILYISHKIQYQWLQFYVLTRFAFASLIVLSSNICLLLNEIEIRVIHYTCLKDPVVIIYVDVNAEMATSRAWHYCRSILVCARAAYTHVIFAETLGPSHLIKYTDVMHDASLDLCDEVSHLLENARNLWRFHYKLCGSAQ